MITYSISMGTDIDSFPLPRAAATIYVIMFWICIFYEIVFVEVSEACPIPLVFVTDPMGTLFAINLK